MEERKELINEWLSNVDNYLNEFNQVIVYMPDGTKVNLNVLIENALIEEGL